MPLFYTENQGASGWEVPVGPWHSQALKEITRETDKGKLSLREEEVEGVKINRGSEWKWGRRKRTKRTVESRKGKEEKCHRSANEKRPYRQIDSRMVWFQRQSASELHLKIDGVREEEKTKEIINYKELWKYKCECSKPGREERD